MPDYAVAHVDEIPAIRNDTLGRRRIVIVVNPNAQSLEYMGPLQVFAEANFFFRRDDRDDIGYDVEVVATSPGAVYELKGFRIEADTPYYRLRGEIDTVIFQAVDEKEVCLQDRKFMDWVSRTASRARRVVSVCAGAYVLAEAGVLNGRRATTHWAAYADFRTRYPQVKLEEDPIYVKDGNVYTSAGATAGLDLTLALVEEDYGREFARCVAQGLVMYMKRPGNQAQFSVHVSTTFAEEPRIRELQMFISENLAADLSVELLAERLNMSPRNFARVFAREVGMPPGRFVEQLRLERARQILEESEGPVSQVAKRCGYRSADGLRLSFERHLGVSPREYRNRFCSASHG